MEFAPLAGAPFQTFARELTVPLTVSKGRGGGQWEAKNSGVRKTEVVGIDRLDIR